MIYKFLVSLLISDSLLFIISLIRGYFLEKNVIKNNLNRMDIKEEYIIKCNNNYDNIKSLIYFIYICLIV